MSGVNPFGVLSGTNRLTTFYGVGRHCLKMATPGKLRQAVAAALGMSDRLEQVDVHLRNLREAGLVLKAKRGGGAANLGVADAVNLLVAIAGAELVKDSAKAVQRYGRLHANPASVTVHGRRDLPVATLPLLDLPPEHGFLEALGRLLTLLGGERFLAEEVHQEFSRRRGRRIAHEYVFVRFFCPYDAAAIHYGALRRFHVQLLYGSLPLDDPRGAWDLRNLRADGRLLTVKIVEQNSLLAIAKAVA
jgi:hypothetical protein